MSGGPRPGQTVHHGPMAVRIGGWLGAAVRSPAGVTEAQAAVWRPSDGNEAAAEEKLSGGSAQSLGEGERDGVVAVRTDGGISLLWRW
jgi:hypothetical protein